MAFGGFNNDQNTPMSEINIIPLVDVMLVLLVIFIITAPVLSHAVKVELPHASSEMLEEDPKQITVAITADGLLYWNDQPVLEAELADRLQQAAQENPEVELRLRADKATPYDPIARVMAEAHRQGVVRIGFVTQPESGG